MRRLAPQLTFATALMALVMREGAAQASTRPADYATAAEAYMQARVQTNGFSGSVLVARAGHPVLRATYGIADRVFDVPNRTDTKFRIGSVTKTFTAAGILLLESRGQLRIDDPVSQHLASWPKGWSSW